ncbi:uncharacterized protein K02A2.6-like [Gigantopelta aegis]|uniref:uncharacterized protein K02A2.6-like n=1 Tax=Gigantopelta aegis TaxID=1735272 RepID=UPI001B88839E|nr:uncharacterized protein K02A2.6-like [Gigantopelta aegis]
MLAVVYGCERFHTYIYGKRFIVESDHKPLEMIHLKNLAAAPQRLQRLFLRIQPYDMRITYRPGKDMLIADGLSRLPSRDASIIDLDVQVGLVQFSSQKLQSIHEETCKDDELQLLKEIILEGWPETQRQIPSNMKSYWPFRDELVIDNGIILKGDRVIIPTSMQTEILNKIHEAHQGIQKMKLRAKTCVFWNAINTDIDKMVKSCHLCQEFQKSQPAETLMQHEVPTRPWQVLGSDLFYTEGQEFLIVCDYYSKFPIIRLVKGMGGTQTVINILKGIFSEQGIPEKLVTENGPHYSSSSFKQFAES